MAGNGDVSNGSSWILALAAPNTEFLVAERLERRGFCGHVFRIKSRRLRRGRMVDAAAPAFPRYLFVSAADDRWGDLLATEGVTGFVRNGGGGPAHVPDTVIADLLARANGETLPVPEARCPFQRGERLIVRGAGVAAGHAAQFEYALGDGLAVVLQEWLGRWVPVTVQLDDLDKLPRRNGKKKRRRHRSNGELGKE
jgi:transcription antitermination factor NusG